MTQYSTSQPVVSMNEHNCFGCGAVNPIGLRLSFYLTQDGNGVRAPWLPTTNYEGYNGMIHGGITTTLLDEIMAWSLYARDTWAVTAKMQTIFRQPVQIGEPVRLVGRVLRDRGRVFELHGEVRRESDDILLAEAEAVFVRVPVSQAQSWSQRYLTAEGTV